MSIIQSNKVTISDADSRYPTLPEIFSKPLWIKMQLDTNIVSPQLHLQEFWKNI